MTVKVEIQANVNLNEYKNVTYSNIFKKKKMKNLRHNKQINQT